MVKRRTTAQSERKLKASRSELETRIAARVDVHATARALVYVVLRVWPATGAAGLRTRGSGAAPPEPEPPRRLAKREIVRQETKKNPKRRAFTRVEASPDAKTPGDARCVFSRSLDPVLS